MRLRPLRGRGFEMARASLQLGGGLIIHAKGMSLLYFGYNQCVIRTHGRATLQSGGGLIMHAKGMSIHYFGNNQCVMRTHGGASLHLGACKSVAILYMPKASPYIILVIISVLCGRTVVRPYNWVPANRWAYYTCLRLQYMTIFRSQFSIGWIHKFLFHQRCLQRQHRAPS